MFVIDPSLEVTGWEAGQVTFGYKKLEKNAPFGIDLTVAFPF